MRQGWVMEGLVFQGASGAAVKVSPEALARMLEFRQFEPRQQEAGGVLLGRYILGCRDVVIDEVTVPMPGDRRSRLAFHRSHAPHQRVMDERWKASRGTCQYLGEWHTHPEACPTPSPVDSADWRRRLCVDRFNGDSLLFLIVGTHKIRAWRGLRHSLALELLQACQQG